MDAPKDIRLNSEIYLDFNSTTPVDPRVVEAMLPYFSEEFGNPASGQHPYGRRAEFAVEAAREEVAKSLGAVPSQVVFTSGSTESSNALLKGLAETAPVDRRRIVVSSTEHKAVLETAEWLEGAGFPVDVVPVDRFGVVVQHELKQVLLGGDVLVVSVIAANNESGTLNPLAELAKLAHEYGAVFHSDATQQAGKLPLDLQALEVDAASVSAHKMYGPKGIGALVLHVALKKRLPQFLHGGGHERGLRSGTVNVPGAVGFGAAAAIALETLKDEASRLLELRDWLHQSLDNCLGGVELNGHPTRRLPNTLNIRIPGADAEAVMANMPTVAVSAGSACTSAVPGPSHVLLAMGLDPDAASESLRFSLGRSTTKKDIERAVGLVVESVSRVRALSQPRVAG